MQHPEAKIQVEIVKFLQQQEIFCHSVPNERRSSPQAMGRLIAMGLRPGVADLVVWWAHGIGYIEVKAEKGRLSDAQKKFKTRCENSGVSYDVVYSLYDVKKLLDSYGYSVVL